MVHTIRAAVRSARVEWKGVNHDESGATLTTNVTFTVEVEEDTLDGGYVARCVDLPGCYSQGDTEEEAVSNLVEAISGVMEARMQRHLRQRTPLHRPDERPERPHRHTLEIPVA
jgi:predicted RNase H-like HicB family nuclease